MNAGAPAPVLSIDALSGGHGDVTVIHHFSAAVAPGELAFVTGRNGVGKSTLVKLVAGHLPVRAGRLTFRGEDLTAAPGHRRRRLGLGYAPQEGIVFDELTVAENLTLQYANRSLDRYETLFARFPFLAERLAQPAGTLSGGEKKILSFCRALAEDTALVILDEPSEGVQAENITRMAAAIREAAAGGRAFLVVEQNLNLVEEVADRVYLLDRGACVYDAPNGPDLRAALLDRLRI